MTTLNMDVDRARQLLVRLSVKVGQAASEAQFKVDTGAGVTVLSHDTLKGMGYAVTAEGMQRLPLVKAVMANGSSVSFRSLGKVSFFAGGSHLFTVNAVCHPTRETHDLLGADALCQFSAVLLSFAGKPFIRFGR